MFKPMIAHAKLTSSFWGDALLTTPYIHNLVPSKSVSATPYELWFDKKSSWITYANAT